MGLPGSGKTTMSEQLKYHLDAEHFEADVVRKVEDDWDFSEKGRMKQVTRMKKLAKQSESNYVICDFVCPYVEGRKILKPDYIVFMDTIEKGRWKDTNKLFQRPSKSEVDYIVEDFNAELHAEIISRSILADQKFFDEREPTVQMLGRFQPFHDGHLELFKRAIEKTGQVSIMVREMHRAQSDPFDFKTVKQNIKMFLLGDGYEENKDYIIQKVPNIVNITYGRRVGYDIEEEKFNQEIEEVSSTELRRQLGVTKEKFI